MILVYLLDRLPPHGGLPVNALHEIKLPEVPAVGDFIDVDVGVKTLGIETYKVVGRRFHARFRDDVQQLVDFPLVYVQVEHVDPDE